MGEDNAGRVVITRSAAPSSAEAGRRAGKDRIPVEIRELLQRDMPNLDMTFEGDPNFDDAKAAWNIITRYSPAGIVQPATIVEIQQIIRLARQASVKQISMRSGGHSFEGLSLGGETGHALVIDMINLNKVAIDTSAKVAEAEGGALLGTIYMEAWKHGQLMLPMGSCVSVGVGGQAQCGGYGHYSRTYGILTDRVQQIEVVTADGELRIANKNENADLFWALRGNGTGSFGVITRLWLELNDAPKAVADFQLRWKITDTDFDEVFAAIQNYTETAPVEFNPMIVIWLGYLELAGSILADTEEKRDQIIKDLRERLPTPATEVIEPMTFIDSVRDLGIRQTSAPWYQDLTKVTREKEEHSRFMKIKAGFMPELFTPEFIHALGKLAQTQPTVGVRVQILGMNPEHDNSVDTESTSIKNRNCPWLMGMSVWIESEDDDGMACRKGIDRLPWLNAAYELFYPYTSGGYIGDDDVNESDFGRDPYESYYGDNLARLKEIKRAYDPDNIFHHTLSIPVD